MNLNFSLIWNWNGPLILECAVHSHLYIDSLNPKGKVSSFKTLEMRAAQSLAAKSTNALKIKKSKIKGVVSPTDFFWEVTRN